MAERLAAAAGEAAREADARLTIAARARAIVNKVFPTHFSFLFGEIALYSFIVLVLSGTYLALFFDPSSAELHYHGVYSDMHDVEMTRAFASTVHISVDVRGGLFVRQMHHWAAHIFVAAIIVHMYRIFFTGAFRKPRDGNWIIGITLLGLGMFEGFLGYSLPDDLLSGTGVRIMSSLVLSIPLVGTWMQWLFFGGEDPEIAFIERFFTMHVLVVPAAILVLVTIHLGLVWYQKHTQFPGQRVTRHNVVGTRMVPTFSLHSFALSMTVIGTTAVLAGVAQINPIFWWGPYDPSRVSNGSEPDWYIGFLIGALRLFPGYKVQFGSYQIPAPFWPGVAMPIAMFAAMYAYPWLERKITGDHALHNTLQRPRDAPGRTAVGVMAITYYFWILLAGGDDIISYRLGTSLEALVYAGRAGVFVLPVLAFVLTYRRCLRLQRGDRGVLDFGLPTGTVIRRGGGYVEVRQPVQGRGPDGNPVATTYQGAPVPRRSEETITMSTEDEPATDDESHVDGTPAGGLTGGTEDTGRSRRD